ncbi:Inositol polyphosphate multikinase [Colletotrichum chlorophyti]|uniref:Kinase n=1 Tax=Colletotrichum chlorophyti TaxID=708187 RepID=A0A1Q8S2N7_9PEZI|nr:Inositol polyphosphate multikinase [Colletotrichum chlorophyti]
MSGKRVLPARSDLVDYNHTVAGHAGTMSSADGTLFIKPCTQAEVDFYESARQHHRDFAQWMPLYMGTLTLTDSADLSSAEEGAPGPLASPSVKDAITQAVAGLSASVATPETESTPSAEPEETIELNGSKKREGKWVPNKAKRIKTDQAIVLENTGAFFVHPNILDVKLGVRLWADDAPEEKKRRFDDITAKTTHGPLGFRIAGMKVYRGSNTKSELDHEDYKIYDKDYGRVHVNEQNVVDTFRKFVFNENTGFDGPAGRLVAASFLDDLRKVEKVLSAEESRMYSASLLFVFEGEAEQLIEHGLEIKTKVERWDAKRKAFEAERAGRKALRVDSGIELSEGDSATATATTTSAAAEDEDDSDEEYQIDEEDTCSVKTHYLRLIDFAHAQWTPGQGPDENVLKGVRSLIKIFEELAAEPAAASQP